MLSRPEDQLRLITCHLGNGCSMAAVARGVSIDTTMGFTPLEGLLMGTRSGDMDTSVILYIMGKEGLTLSEATTLLNKHSGLQGVSGLSSDMREIVAEMKQENKRAIAAFEIFTYRVKKYIGAYAAVMGGLDAVIFTGGIGENSSEVRQASCEGLEFLGIKVDEAANAVRNGERSISRAGSRTAVLVIPTNEELVIALDTEEIVRKLENAPAVQVR
jgi:acetate kinase